MDRRTVCYQQIAPVRMPLALAELHQSLGVGAPVEVAISAQWRPSDLRALLTGAGFAVRSTKRDADQVRVRAVRERTLPDVVKAGMGVLVCGLNPSLYAADAGIGFARPGNRFWPAAQAAGLVTADRDPWDALSRHRVGFTDIVKRATPTADQLTRDEYRTGLSRLMWLVEWLAPRVTCFVGLAGWRAVVERTAQPGIQPASFAGAIAYVMPSTSGLNATSTLSSLTDHLRAARSLAGDGP